MGGAHPTPHTPGLGAPSWGCQPPRAWGSSPGPPRGTPGPSRPPVAPRAAEGGPGPPPGPCRPHARHCLRVPGALTRARGAPCPDSGAMINPASGTSWDRSLTSRTRCLMLFPGEQMEQSENLGLDSSTPVSREQSATRLNGDGRRTGRPDPRPTAGRRAPRGLAPVQGGETPLTWDSSAGPPRSLSAAGFCSRRPARPAGAHPHSRLPLPLPRLGACWVLILPQESALRDPLQAGVASRASRQHWASDW